MSYFYDFLLISRKTDEAEKIQNDIMRNKHFRVETIENAHLALEKIVHRKLHCVVYNFDNFTVGKLNLITGLRDLGYNFPIVVCASEIERDALIYVNKKLSKVVLLPKPYDIKNFWGITEKLINGQKVKQQIAQRFVTQAVIREEMVVKKVTKGPVTHVV